MVDEIAVDLIRRNLLQMKNGAYQLTDSGILISNQIFEKFTFLE